MMKQAGSIAELQSQHQLCKILELALLRSGYFIYFGRLYDFSNTTYSHEQLSRDTLMTLA